MKAHRETTNNGATLWNPAPRDKAASTRPAMLRCCGPRAVTISPVRTEVVWER
jgi:hypothetical protein